jgi:hypothetical protein
VEEKGEKRKGSEIVDLVKNQSETPMPFYHASYSLSREKCINFQKLREKPEIGKRGTSCPTSNFSPPASATSISFSLHVKKVGNFSVPL